MHPPPILVMEEGGNSPFWDCVLVKKKHIVPRPLLPRFHFGSHEPAVRGKGRAAGRKKDAGRGDAGKGARGEPAAGEEKNCSAMGIVGWRWGGLLVIIILRTVPSILIPAKSVSPQLRDQIWIGQKNTQCVESTQVEEFTRQ